MSEFRINGHHMFFLFLYSQKYFIFYFKLQDVFSNLKGVVGLLLLNKHKAGFFEEKELFKNTNCLNYVCHKRFFLWF